MGALRGSRPWQRDGVTILSETTYRWDGQNIIGEEDKDGNGVEYLVMPFSLMDNVVSMKREGQDYYYLSDSMGTVYQVVDANGNLVNSYDYNAWGEIRGAQTTETVANPFRWQTKPWDEETGLYYSRARYYEAGSGRFVGVDPLEASHRYSWPGGNPCTSADPTGEAVVHLIVLGAGALSISKLGVGLYSGHHCGKCLNRWWRRTSRLYEAAKNHGASAQELYCLVKSPLCSPTECTSICADFVISAVEAAVSATFGYGVHKKCCSPASGPAIPGKGLEGWTVEEEIKELL